MCHLTDTAALTQKKQAVNNLFHMFAEDLLDLKGKGDELKE